MTDESEVETRVIPYELEMGKAQKVMEKIFEIFKEHELSAQEGLGCLSYAVAFTILSQLGPDTFEENMQEFNRLTRIIFTGMNKQVEEGVEKFKATFN